MRSKWRSIGGSLMIGLFVAYPRHRHFGLAHVLLIRGPISRGGQQRRNWAKSAIRRVFDGAFGQNRTSTRTAATVSAAALRILFGASRHSNPPVKAA